MKRLFPIVLGALCSLVVLLPRGAAGETPEMTVLDQGALERVFTNLVLERASLPAADLQVTHFTSSPKTITAPPGKREFRVVSQGRGKGIGQQTMVADLLVNGVVSARVTLSGDLQIQGDVVCAARSLSRHRLLTADDLVRVRRNLTMLGPDLVTDAGQAIGKEIKTTLQPGAPLYGRLLKGPEVVKRGDIVEIRAASGAITITVQGRVQIAGAKGDLITVKNMMSRKEIVAKVLGPRTVQAEL
jgi:flagella basal body P-ring formation protein FlgA